jgi:HTH-type transcriptional regulator, sugar sensing transcriptional regulator
MNEREELINSLTHFGLDKADAIVYLGLLQMGSVTVGTMSSKLDIDRGKAYRSLNKLRNLGLVSTTFSNPTICEATTPDEALTTIIQKKEDDVITMQKLSRKIVKDLNQVTKEPTVSEVSSFSIIQGRSNIYARIGKLIQDSTSTIYIITTVEDILRMYHTAIPEKINICKKNGGQVRLLTQTKSENLLPLIDRLNADETRIGKLPSKSRMIVEEGKQLIMSGSIKETMNLNDDNDSILYTNSSEMINNMFSLCTHLWKKSKPVELVKAKNS